MILLGLDASTKSTGWAILKDGRLGEYGLITSASDDLFKRITKQVNELKVILTNNKIDKIILEEVRPETGNQNVKTHKALMYLQGAILMMIHDSFPKIKVEFLYPSEWRKACGINTGRGVTRSSLKPQDIAFVKQVYNITVNDDIADAIGLAYAYNQNNTEKIEWGE